MREPRFETLAVLSRGARAGAAGQADHHRHACLAAEHEADLRRLVDDLLHRERDEIRELDLEHGTHAGHRGADRRPGESQFADGSVDHALRSEALQEIARHAEGAAVHADVLPEEKDARIGFHGLREPLADRLRVRQLLRLGGDWLGKLSRHRHPA